MGAWYRALRKPRLQPPDWLFGPAWTVILGLAGYAGVLAWDAAVDGIGQRRVLVFFGVNFFFHLLWSPLFFTWKRPDWALFEVTFLWSSVLAMIIGLSGSDGRIVWLLLPYLLWVGFAAWLNWAVVRLNEPFGARAEAVRGS